MNVPDPVMSLALMPKAQSASGNFSKALNRCSPQLNVFSDEKLVVGPCARVLDDTEAMTSRRPLRVSQGNCAPFTYEFPLAHQFNLIPKRIMLYSKLMYSKWEPDSKH